MTTTLRNARPADEPFLRRVYASTREEELAPLDWSADRKRHFVDMQFDAQHAHYHEHFPDADYQIILRDGEPVGRLYVHRRPDEIRIVDIALLAEHRNTGIGSALVGDLQAEASAAGKPLRIHVEKFNPALRLYQRLGFAETQDEGVYLLMEWRPKRARKAR